MSEEEDKSSKQLEEVPSVEKKKKKRKKDKKDRKRSHESGDEESKSETKPEEGESSEESIGTATCAQKDDKVVQVHSANAWEKADLGSEAKKAKFLKLMGATKKDHKGKFVIGDASKVRETDNVTEGKKLNQELEKDYKDKMSGQLSRAKHCGLGFGANTSIPASHDVGVDHKMHFISEDHKKKVDL